MTATSRSGLIKTTLLLTSTLTVMAGATISPSLPQIRAVFADVEMADTLVKLVLTMPAAFIALGAPFAGMVIDRFGRIRLLIASVLLYALAGTTGLYLDTLPTILAGRAFLGLAVAGIMTVCSTLVGDYFEGEERNSFMSQQGAFMAAGGVVYVALGGWLADLGWRVPFALYGSALLFVPLILFALYEPKVSNDSEQSGTEPPASGRPFLASLVMVYSICILGLAIFYMIPVQMPFLIKEVSDSGNWLIGVSIAGTMLFGAVGSILYKTLKRKLHYQHIYAVSFAVQAVGYILIAMAGNYLQLIPGLLISGIGAGLLLPNAGLWLVNVSPVAIRGKVLGGMTTAVFAGQFLSPIILRPVIEASSLQGSFLWVGIAMVFIPLLLVAIPLRWTSPQNDAPVAEPS